MSLSLQEFAAFSEFAVARLADQSTQTSLDDLVVEWESQRNRQEINAAIREGLADAQEGRVRSAEAVLAELREKHGLESQ